MTDAIVRVAPPLGARCRLLVGGRPVVGVVTGDGLVATRLESPLDGLDEDGDFRTSWIVPGPPLDPERAAFLPPVVPRTMLYCGRNYEDHLAENPRPRQPTPSLFAKLVSSLIGHRGVIRVRPGQHADYEGELALVIGRRARRVPAERALDVVAGFTIANDVSDRAVQHVNNQLTMGKGPDTFGPLGPWLVPRAIVGNGAGLRLRTWVNGELRQDGNTSDLIHGIAETIEAATATVTLEPGDVIATGTPAGVGAYRTPPAWLAPGDVVTITIDRVGTLENPIEADEA